MARTGWSLWVGQRLRVVTDWAPCNGVAWAPEKLTKVEVLGNYNVWATQFETNDMDAPESNNAQATICLPPGPLMTT